MNPDEVYRLALEVYGDPVEARIAAAQMQLETGGGSAIPGNNLFGIKGPGQSLRTRESVGGAMVPTTASFRTYPDLRASIVDRLRFLQTNPRYTAAGYFDATTPEEKAEALQRAGYATDPNYAAKLKNILSGGDSMIFDASRFPQFAPGGLGLAPVSAQPAGVLGVTPAQPLLGPAQPPGVLDRFAPGSGYGYDVALGIANTPGGPMTALAGGFAHAKNRAFERQMAEANLGIAQAKLGMPAGPTGAMRNYEYLISQGVDPETARTAAFGGKGLTVNVGQQAGTQYGPVPSGHTRNIDAQGRVIDTPNPGTEVYEKRQQAKRASDSAIVAINKLKDLVATHGEGFDLIGDSRVKLEMGTLYEEILAALGTLSNAGVMDKSEVERFEESLPDPREKFTFAGAADINAAYDSLLKRIYRVRGEKPPEAGPEPTHRMNPRTGEIEPIQ